MNKILLVFISSIVFVILFSGSVLSVGITPGRTTLDFSPGLQKNVDLIVINSQKADLDLTVNVQGELNNSITLNEKTLHMSPSEEEKKISFSIKLPESLSSGLHTAEVVVTQRVSKSSSGQADVGAQLAVASQISVFVPYPGKYVDASLLVSGDEKNKNFVVSLVNRGTENIEKASAIIYIYDALNKTIKKIETKSVSIKASEKGDVSAQWNVDVPRGKYNAKAVINYDGKEIYVQKEFTVGEILLDLQQIFVKDFKLGDIAKFQMIVQNKWNEPITNAYAEMRVFDNAMNEIADVKSATYDIPADLKTEMVYYWDTKGINADLYNANVILYYADKKTQQDLKLDVKADSITVLGLGYAVSSESSSGNSGLVTILSMIIGFLVLLNVLWFFVLRKRKLGIRRGKR